MKNLQKGSITAIAVISVAVLVTILGIFYFKNKNNSNIVSPVVVEELDPLAEAKARAEAERKVLADLVARSRSENISIGDVDKQLQLIRQSLKSSLDAFFQNLNSENLTTKIAISDADLKKEIISERKDINNSIAKLDAEIKKYTQSFKNDLNSNTSVSSILSSANTLVSQIENLINLLETAVDSLPSNQTNTINYYNNLINQANQSIENIGNTIENIQNNQNNNQSTVVTQNQINTQTNTVAQLEQEAEDLEDENNESPDEEDTETSDTVLPNVSITSPSNNQYVSYVVTISASASDNVGISKVEFYHGSTLIDTDTTIPYIGIWNTTTLQDGTYSLSAKAYDSSNNVKTSTSVSVSIDNGEIEEQNPNGNTDPELIEGSNKIEFL